MSNSLKCPNPSCPFLFDPSQVPAGAVLTCPRCGMRFTLGPTAGMPPPQPAEPSPPASPEYLEPELSIPPPAQTESPAYKKTRTGTRPKSKAGESFPWLPLLGIIAVVATAIGVGVLLFQSQSGGTSTAGEKIFRDVNIAYKAPETDWDQDDEPKRVMNANLLAKIGPRLPLSVVSRPAAASPATGSKASHDLEQQRLLAEAFGG